MNTANIEIKNITNADRSAVLDMMEQLYYSPAVLTNTPRRVLQKCLDDAIRGLPQIEGYVLKADGEYAGYSLVAKGYTTEFGGICIQIEDLFILPAHRGKSIGTAFLRFIEDKYRGEAALLRLEVEPSNANALALYKKCGFNELPYTEMIKKL